MKISILVVTCLVMARADACIAADSSSAIGSRIEQILKISGGDMGVYIADLKIEETIVYQMQSRQEQIEELKQQYDSSDDLQQSFETADEFVEFAQSLVGETAEADAQNSMLIKVRLSPSGSYAKVIPERDHVHVKSTYEEVQYQTGLNEWSVVRYDHEDHSVRESILKRPNYYDAISQHYVHALDMMAWTLSAKRYEQDNNASLMEALITSPNQQIISGVVGWKLKLSDDHTLATLTSTSIHDTDVLRKYVIDIGLEQARIVEKQYDDSKESQIWKFYYSPQSNGYESVPITTDFVLKKRNSPGEFLKRKTTLERMTVGTEWSTQHAYQKIKLRGQGD